MVRSRLFSHFKNQEKEFVKLLKTLVSFRTFSHEKININIFVDYLDELFSEFNLEKERLKTTEGDILSLTSSGQKETFVVLLAHMDTARVSDSLSSIEIKGNRFYGNGCFDMKSAIAIFYFFLKALKDMKIDLKKKIKLVFTPDEETGSKVSKTFLLNACQNSQAVILPEPCCANGGVKIKRKGVVEFKAEIKGEATHSGGDEVNKHDANRALIEFFFNIDKIMKKYPEVTFNPGLLSGGVGTNIVSPFSVLKGEFRSHSTEILEDLLTEIKEIKHIDDLTVNVETELVHPAMNPTTESLKLYHLAKKIARSLDYSLPACSTGGASDGASLAHAGIAVIDGLGIKGGGAHSLKEYIEISDFAFRVTLLTSLCLEI